MIFASVVADCHTNSFKGIIEFLTPNYLLAQWSPYAYFYILHCSATSLLHYNAVSDSLSVMVPVPNRLAWQGFMCFCFVLALSCSLSRLPLAHARATNPWSSVAQLGPLTKSNSMSVSSPPLGDWFQRPGVHSVNVSPAISSQYLSSSRTSLSSFPLERWSQ